MLFYGLSDWLKNDVFMAKKFNEKQNLYMIIYIGCS